MDRRNKEKIIPIEIYTDGSSKQLGKIRFGGWGFCAVQDGKLFYYNSGGEDFATNQQMELTAIIKGVQYAQTIRKPNEKVIVYSDSAYAINCYLKQWYLNWEANGWVNSSKNPVANQQLWQELIPYFENFWYDFRKIQGHAGQIWNEQSDMLAQKAAEEQKFAWRG